MNDFKFSRVKQSILCPFWTNIIIQTSQTSCGRRAGDLNTSTGTSITHNGCTGDSAFSLSALRIQRLDLAWCDPCMNKKTTLYSQIDCNIYAFMDSIQYQASKHSRNALHLSHSPKSWWFAMVFRRSVLPVMRNDIDQFTDGHLSPLNVFCKNQTSGENAIAGNLTTVGYSASYPPIGRIPGVISSYPVEPWKV